ncbi:putative disease resistance protein rdl5, partial [Quercus suber]
MVRKKDRFWEYVEDLKGRFKCNFCKREFAGGATRIKCHLAGVKCHDIDICTEVSKEVQEEASLIIGEPNKKLKGASTSNRDKKKEINSTSIPTDVTLGRVFEKSKEEYSTEIDLSVAVEGLLAKVRSLLIDHIEIKMKNIIDRLLDTIKNGLRVGSMDTIPKISLDSGVDSYLNDLEIVGRGCDVSKIVNMLTNASNQRISILPIMGMAGLGKTTLAKEVYNNELIRKHFDSLAWVHDFTKLRSLVSDYADFGNTLSNFKSLRVLKLYGDSIIEVPDSIEHLIHLRLLHISHSLNTCVSLQKLVVGCGDLRYLPGVPSSIIRSGIEDLPTGSEYLENWDCLPSSSIQLSLQSLKFNRGPDTLLDQIQYFIALKILWIQECNEMVDLPESLDNISSLQQLYLVCCRNLEHLPTKEAMQRLTQLKKLVISRCPKFEHNERIKISHVPLVDINSPVLEIFGMEKVRCIGSEFYSDESCKNTILFPALRILKLEEMRVLEEWKDAKELTIAGEVLVFPCLEKLTLFDCPKLRYLPDSLNTCDSLQKLVVGCGDLRYLPGVPSSIIRSGIEDLPTGSEYLENWDCLPSSSTYSIQPSLQSIKLFGSDTLLDQIQYFIALKILWIEVNSVTAAILQRVGLTQGAGEKFAFGKIIKLKTTVAKSLQ